MTVELSPGARLPRDFYARDTLTVTRALLGQRLVRIFDGLRLSGLITETEAYGGPDDEASHAFRRTPRSDIMYGAPGYAYVYFIYGVHYCLNAVTEPERTPGAVLIRGIAPREGMDVMRAHRRAARRANGDAGLTDGPAKLCQALAITGVHNGLDLTTGDALFIEAGPPVADAEVALTARIGVRGNDEARGRLWRFAWGGPGG